MTTVIVYDHRGRTAKGRPGALEVRLTIQKRVYYIATGIKVMKSEWVVNCLKFFIFEPS